MLLLGLAAAASAVAAADTPADAIQLDLSPRVCTLTANDRQCDVTVHASWHAERNESLCLVIVERPDVKRCWENYTHGVYSIALTFADDLIFQLRDLPLQNVLASATLRVIREVLRYRHKRREPWNIFE